MINDTHLQKVREEWKGIADSDWYMSYRTEEVIAEILQSPQTAFHKKTWEVICSSFPSLKNRKILVPSSGDNRAVFAFAHWGQMWFPVIFVRNNWNMRKKLQIETT